MAKQVNCMNCGDTECSHAGKEEVSYCGNFIQAKIKVPRQPKFKADVKHRISSTPKTKRIVKEAVNNKIIEEELW